MLSKSDIEQILTTALSKGGDFADIFIESSDQTSIALEDGKMDKISSGTDAGAGIRVIKDKMTYYACSNDANLPTLLQKAEELSRSVASISKRIKITLKPSPPSSEMNIKRRPNSVPMDEKAALVIKANETARSFGKNIRQVTVRYADSNQAVTIANSNGAYVEDNRVRTRIAIQITAEKDGVLQTGYEAPGGTVGFELFEEFDPVKLAASAAQRALMMLDAKHAPSGQMPVVISSDAGGTMVHEACGHALEADFINKGTSVFAGKIGKKVAAECVTVVDDATYPGKFGTYRFDDEGTPAQKKCLIENGILRGYMSDVFNANALEMLSSGNGRRETFRTKPIPRMTNTFIQSGMTDPKAIIASVKNGLLVKKMGGGQVNVTNGDFVFEVTEAYIIDKWRG